MQSIESIKQAVDSGNRVYWINESYPVIKDKLGQYLVHHADICVGLNTGYRPIDFYINGNPFNRATESLNWLTYEWHLSQDRLREYDRAGLFAHAELISDVRLYPQLIAAEKARQHKTI